jgi:uncharacterized membrane protein YdjX (TVP38/TMEM64 family)
MDAPAPRPPRRWRLLALAAVVVATLVVGRASGATESLSVEGVRRAVEDAGLVGLVLFVALFAVGELLHVPGLVFVAAAVAIWGPVAGGLAASAGALVSLVTSFAVVRGVGGSHRPAPRWAFLERLLAGLERRPVATVALARAVFILSPPVTYALALSPVRFRDYLVGSALGLVAPLTVAVLVFDRVV